MINLAISLAIAILLALLFMVPLGMSAWLALPFALLVGVVAFVLLGRKVQEKLERIMAQVQRDVQANKLDRAIETLKAGLHLKHRHLFVASQLHAQIGMFYYIKKDYDAALPYLQKGFIRHYISQLMLACIHYRRKQMDEMKSVLKSTLSANKKEPLVYATYAYLLYQTKQKEKAIEILQQGLKKLPKDERLQTNLTLLQNNKRMKMRVFGDMWTQLMLERPPRQMQQQMGPGGGRMSKKALFR